MWTKRGVMGSFDKCEGRILRHLGKNGYTFLVFPLNFLKGGNNSFGGVHLGVLNGPRKRTATQRLTLKINHQQPRLRNNIPGCNLNVIYKWKLSPMNQENNFSSIRCQPWNMFLNAVCL